jgi:hypothetical protein
MDWDRTIELVIMFVEIRWTGEEVAAVKYTEALS